MVTSRTSLEIEKEGRRWPRRKVNISRGQERRAEPKVQSSFRLTAYLIKTTLSLPVCAVKRRSPCTTKHQKERGKS